MKSANLGYNMGNIKNLKIKNFGPIKQANIDVSPLTIFMGPNNSGKSFVGQIIQCFNSCCYNSDDMLNIAIHSTKYFDKTSKELFSKFNNQINEYIKNNSYWLCPLKWGFDFEK